MWIGFKNTDLQCEWLTSSSLNPVLKRFLNYYRTGQTSNLTFAPARRLTKLCTCYITSRSSIELEKWHYWYTFLAFQDENECFPETWQNWHFKYRKNTEEFISQWTTYFAPRQPSEAGALTHPLKTNHSDPYDKPVEHCIVEGDLVNGNERCAVPGASMVLKNDILRASNTC